MPGDHDFFVFRHMQIAREIVFHFRKRYFFHSGIPRSESHATARAFVISARTCTS
jgi:hypothetical protein